MATIYEYLTKAPTLKHILQVKKCDSLFFYLIVHFVKNNLRWFDFIKERVLPANHSDFSSTAFRQKNCNKRADAHNRTIP